MDNTPTPQASIGQSIYDPSANANNRDHDHDGHTMTIVDKNNDKDDDDGGNDDDDGSKHTSLDASPSHTHQRNPGIAQAYAYQLRKLRANVKADITNLTLVAKENAQVNQRMILLI